MIKSSILLSKRCNLQRCRSQGEVPGYQYHLRLFICLIPERVVNNMLEHLVNFNICESM